MRGGARPWVEIVPADGMSATLKGNGRCSKRVSKKSVCNPEQRRRVWGSGDMALLPVGRRFFDFAQNDSCFARNDIFYTMLPAALFGHPLRDSVRHRVALDDALSQSFGEVVGAGRGDEVGEFPSAGIGLRVPPRRGSRREGSRRGVRRARYGFPIQGMRASCTASPRRRRSGSSQTGVQTGQAGTRGRDR